MECVSVYETFDFLATAPILSHVIKLQKENKKKFESALKKVASCKKNEDEKGRLAHTAIAIEHATIYNLCRFFLQTKDSHDMHVALNNLDTLEKKEQDLVNRQEFEAAAIVRDEKIPIRHYLTKLNKSGKQNSEGSLVNIL